MSELGRLQADFAAALDKPGAEDAILAMLEGSAQRNRDWLAIYRGNANANALRALEYAYPVVRELVGEEFFVGLARAYRQVQPSQSGDLNLFGAAFASFLAGFPPAQALPYLAEVARLEWALSRVACAADHQPLPLAALADCAPETLAGLCWALQPGLQLLASDWPIVSIWQQHQPGAERRGIDERRSEWAAVCRVGWRAEVRPLDAAGFAFWSAAQSGAPLAEMIADAFDADGDFDVQAQLQAGFAAEFVIALRPQQHLDQET